MIIQKEIEKLVKHVKELNTILNEQTDKTQEQINVLKKEFVDKAKQQDIEEYFRKLYGMEVNVYYQDWKYYVAILNGLRQVMFLYTCSDEWKILSYLDLSQYFTRDKCD